MSAGGPVLAVTDLAYAYPDGHQALYGVNLSLEPGERVALLGPNGAGKTTLVLHLNGILSPGHGAVSIASWWSIGSRRTGTGTSSPTAARVACSGSKERRVRDGPLVRTIVGSGRSSSGGHTPPSVVGGNAGAAGSRTVKDGCRHFWLCRGVVYHPKRSPKTRSGWSLHTAPLETAKTQKNGASGNRMEALAPREIYQ